MSNQLDMGEAIGHVAEAFADSIGAVWTDLTDDEKQDFIDGASVMISAHIGWMSQSGLRIVPPGAIISPSCREEAVAMFNAAKAYLKISTKKGGLLVKPSIILPGVH